MGFKSSSLFCLAIFLAISSSIHAGSFNITKLLSQYPQFATFDKYLTEFNLAPQINGRNTITVLAVNEAAISTISGKSPQAIKAIISTHVILDYFDMKKLNVAQKNNEVMTTLYQTTGLAVYSQGFLKVKLVNGVMNFGSAQSGAPMDVALMETIYAAPYNISILQVAKPIIFPGIDAPSKSNASAPAAAKNAAAPTTSAASPPEEPVTLVPAEAPTAEEPSADAPTPDAASPSADAPGPAGGEDAADAATPSSSSRTVVGLVGALMCFASLLV